MKKYFDPELKYITFDTENVLTASGGPTSVELVKQSMEAAGHNTSENTYVIVF